MIRLKGHGMIGSIRFFEQVLLNFLETCIELEFYFSTISMVLLLFLFSYLYFYCSTIYGLQSIRFVHLSDKIIVKHSFHIARVCEINMTEIIDWNSIR